MTELAASAAVSRGARSGHFDRAAVGLLLLLSWQVASISVGGYWISSPIATGARFIQMALSGELLSHASYTMSSAAIGFVVGGVPGLLLPFALRRFPTLLKILDPFMIGGYGIPKLALAPLFLLWFGIGIESKVAVVASITFFLVYFNASAGVRALNLKLVQMATVMGATERSIARHVVWPSAVPYIFAGFRISTPYAIGGAVIAELISSNRGLGYLIQLGAMNFDTNAVFASLVATTLLVAGSNWLVQTGERRLLHWRPKEGAANPPGGT